jgi:hypothetical protein
MPIYDIDQLSWLEAFQICRDAVLTRGSTKNLVPGTTLPRSYFVHDDTAIVSLKAVAKLAHRISRQSFSDNEGKDTQSKKIYDHINSLDYLKDLGIVAVKNPNLKEGLYSQQQAGESDPPSGGYYDGKSKIRRNQKTFKDQLILIEPRCIVSGCDILEILHGCHIDAYSETQDHSADNGLLLRSDLHRLFDLGKLGYSHEKEAWIFSADTRKWYKKFDGQKPVYSLKPKTIERLNRHFTNSELSQDT